MTADVAYRDWLIGWLAGQKPFLKEATFATYSQSIINHLIPTLGGCLLCDITEQMVQKAALSWLECGRCDGKGGLSHKSVKDMIAIVRASIRAAELSRNVAHSPLRIKLPPVTKPSQVEVFSAQELQTLVQAATTSPTNKKVGLMLALYSGLRIGELCALQWRDIDLAANTISVDKTVQRIYTKSLGEKTTSKIIVTPPKTPSSIRMIPLASEILHLVESLAASGDRFLITGMPTLLEPRSYRAWYGRFLRRNGIKHSSFHKLRHTFATRLIENGADVKTVSAILGHSSVRTTLDLYVHPQMDQKRKCIDMMPSFRNITVTDP
jgi:integrase